MAKVDEYESIHKTLGDKVCISTTTRTIGDIIDEDFTLNLIQGFSPKQNYVLDIFTGGVVLHQSLMTRRRSIAFCKDDLEAMSLEAKCSQTLEDNPLLQEWFGFAVSS